MSGIPRYASPMTNSSNSALIWIILVIAILLLGLAIWILIKLYKNPSTPIPKSTYYTCNANGECVISNTPTPYTSISACRAGCNTLPTGTYSIRTTTGGYLGPVVPTTGTNTGAILGTVSTLTPWQYDSKTGTLAVIPPNSTISSTPLYLAVNGSNIILGSTAIGGWKLTSSSITYVPVGAASTVLPLYLTSTTTSYIVGPSPGTSFTIAPFTST